MIATLGVNLANLPIGITLSKVLLAKGSNHVYLFGPFLNQILKYPKRLPRCLPFMTTLHGRSLVF
jgi:hypothetical protein